MRITTTYFGPTELKNLNISTSRGPTAYVTHCHSAWPTVALMVNRPNCNCLIHIQLRLIIDTHYITRSTKLQLSYSYSKCVFETIRFIGFYQLAITLKHFKHELSSCSFEYM